MSRVCLPAFGLLIGGADCAPQLGIAEAADCCACLAESNADGDEAGADVLRPSSDNCLPDDLSQGRSQKVEQDQCAADAADSIGGASEVVVDVACLADDRPCESICSRAAAKGVVFAE